MCLHEKLCFFLIFLKCVVPLLILPILLESPAPDFVKNTFVICANRRGYFNHANHDGTKFPRGIEVMWIFWCPAKSIFSKKKIIKPFPSEARLLKRHNQSISSAMSQLSNIIYKKKERNIYVCVYSIWLFDSDFHSPVIYTLGIYRPPLSRRIWHKVFLMLSKWTIFVLGRYVDI